jgi:hypothetical protein
MADFYWVGGNGNWSDYAAHWATTSGGAIFRTNAPTSADNVFFNDSSAAGTFTVTIDTATAVCANFDASGITNAARKMTLTGTTSVGLLSVNGNWTNPSATYFAWTTWTGNTVTFAATGTIITNAVSFVPAIIINGASATVTLGGALTASSTITLTNGTFDTSVSNYSLSATGITISANSNTRALNLNASAVTLSGASPYTDSSTGGYTLSAGTSTITCSNANPTFAGAGKTFYNISFSSAASGFPVINGANTFNDFSVTSRSATGTKTVTFGANTTVNGTLTLGAANTAIRRIFIVSSTIGTQRTLTVATFAATTDVDFRDIQAAGASVSVANWNSAGTGRFGNAGGNGNKITFDTPKTVYWNLAAGGNWSATAWATATGSGAAVNVNNFPLAQDTAVFQGDTATLADGNTITLDNSWLFGTIDLSARTTPTYDVVLSTTTLSPINISGDFKLGTGSTVTGTSGTINFYNGNSALQTITSNGITINKSIASYVGSQKIADNLTLAATFSFSLISGAFDLNGKTLSCPTFTNTGSATRSIAFNGGTISLSGSGATVWNATGSGFTTSAGTGNGTISLTSASAKTFVGGGYTYAAALNQGGAGALTITGNNTFSDITNTYGATGATTINFTAGTTQTVSQFTASGTSGNLLSLRSTVAGSQFILSDASGTNSVSYCDIKDSRAIGGATWLAYTTNGNVNSGNNSYWQFATPVVYSYSTDVKLRSLAQRGRV